MPTSAPTSKIETGARLDLPGILAFLGISFGLTWALEFLVLRAGGRFDNAHLGRRELAVLALSMFVPALAAFVVRRFVTREGFADAGLRLGPRYLYVLVWLGVPLLYLAAYGLTALFGLGHLDLSAHATLEMIRKNAPPGAPVRGGPGTFLLGAFFLTLTMALLMTCVATFGEEFGWTGYLLPKLLPLGRFRAALGYGLIWGLWHAPAIWGGYNYPGRPVLGIAMMCLFTMALALIQCSLRLRSGSVILTSFFHAGINTQARGIWPLVVVGASPFLGGILGVTGLFVLYAAGLSLLSRTPEPVAADLAPARGRS